MRSRLTALAVCLWATGLAAGFAAWMEYDATPGASAKETQAKRKSNRLHARFLTVRIVYAINSVRWQ